MADKDNMTVDQVLAACRVADGADQGQPATPASEAPSALANPPASSTPAASPAKPAGQMSMDEILAAARGQDSSQATAPIAAAESATANPPADKPSAKPAAQMSMAEMLAAARGEKTRPAAAKPVAPASGKAAAAKPAAKASPKAPIAAAAGPRDTSSILAAARKPAKPGPMSKAEAAAKGTVVAAGKKVAPPKPAKPAYARPQPTKAGSSDEHRRGFLSVLFGSFLAVGFTSLSAVSALWSLGLARFMFPNILTEPPSRFTVGFPADFAPDTVTTKYKAQFGVWVVNTEYEGQRMITALKSVCTHLGCTPNWLEGEQKFKCPCHGSGFYKDGINFEGPAPRPLERYAIQLADDGQIEIDKSKKFQQEMGQWSSSSSFVPIG